MKLSIIVPVFNEAKTVAEIVARVMRVPIEKEIVLVDDGSTDGTAEILAGMKGSPGVVIAHHEKNRGKGAAIRTGIGLVSGEFVLIQDADLEYDPEDYPLLLKPVEKGKAEVVYGSRFTGERRNMFFHHWIGNRLLTFLTNALYNTTLSDMETCYKLFRTDILKSLRLREDRFEFEPEVTAKVLKSGHRIYEVPVSYAGRDYHEGKKITWRDGFGALWTLIKYRFVD